METKRQRTRIKNKNSMIVGAGLSTMLSDFGTTTPTPRRDKCTFVQGEEMEKLSGTDHRMNTYTPEYMIPGMCVDARLARMPESRMGFRVKTTNQRDNYGQLQNR